MCEMLKVYGTWRCFQKRMAYITRRGEAVRLTETGQALGVLGRPPPPVGRPANFNMLQNVSNIAPFSISACF